MQNFFVNQIFLFIKIIYYNKNHREISIRELKCKNINLKQFEKIYNTIV